MKVVGDPEPYLTVYPNSEVWSSRFSMLMTSNCDGCNITTSYACTCVLNVSVFYC